MQSSAHATTTASNHGFTLEKYLSHIGLTNQDVKEPSLASLQTIIAHHLKTFYYQNASIYAAGKKKQVQDRSVPSLEIDKLFALMTEQHSGYCMQHLELLCAALVAAGFTVDRHLAKVVLQPCSKPLRDDSGYPKTHELLIVHLNDKPYIVDVGMGDLCLRRPLELKEGEQTIYDDQYRLTKVDAVWTLDTKTAKEADWFCVYRFLNYPNTKDNIKEAHKTLYTSPKHLPIRDTLLFISQTTPEKRKSLCWYWETGRGIFESIKRDSDKEKKKELTTLEDVLKLAEAKFGFKMGSSAIT